MKPMNNFAAEQLTKKQMNEVKGGAKIELFECITPDGRYTIITADERFILVDQVPLGTTCTRI